MLDWVILLGLIVCLAILSGLFVYFVRSGFDHDDITRIDPFPEEKKEE